jgi:recombination protein RecA
VARRKKPKAEAPSKSVSKLARFAAQVTKQYGGGSIMTADQVSKMTVPRVQTGIFAFDAATGGGFPIGRMSMVFGEESTGKSTLYIKAVAAAQRMCASCYRVCELEPGFVETIDANTGEVKEVESMIVGSCECGNPRSMVVAWVDQEGTWKSDWAAEHGVYEERLIMSRPVIAEEAVDIIDALLGEGLADIVVLDSIAEMSPATEVDQSAVDSYNNPGLHARIMNSAIRKWNSGFNAMFKASMRGENVSIPSLWLVNQTRQKVGVTFGSPETIPGGFGQKFAVSLTVRTRKLKYKVPQDEALRKTMLLDTHWVELGLKVVKNKVSAAQQEGTYRLCLRDVGPFKKGQVLDHDDVLFYALKYEVVEQLSAQKYACAGEEFKGKSGVTDRWATDPKLYEIVKQETLNRHLANA